MLNNAVTEVRTMMVLDSEKAESTINPPINATLTGAIMNTSPMASSEANWPCCDRLTIGTSMSGTA